MLDFNYASLDTTGGPVSFNADLYGLGHVDAPPGMDGNWFFEGPAQDTRTRDSLGTGSIASGAVSLIEDDILTTATTTGRVATSNTTALIDFIDSLYDDGAEAGDFAVFHFVADEIVSTLSGARGFRITHSGGDPADFAFLQITTQQIQQVPEPASLLLWGLLGGAMAAGVVWKRRKNPSR